MKTGMITMLILMAFSASSSEITLKVESKNGAPVLEKATAVYLTTNNSFFCTKLSTTDGSFERVPKVSEETVLPVRSVLTLQDDKNDRCQTKLKGLSLKFKHPMLSVYQSQVQVVDTNESQGDRPQKLVFKKIKAPYGDFLATSGEVKIGPDNAATVEVVIAE